MATSSNHNPKLLRSAQTERATSYRNMPPQRHIMQGFRAPVHVSAAISSELVERKLRDLTLEVEKELNTPNGAEDYFGSCSKCGQGVYGAATACQAMGKIYHNKCFVCGCCGRTLRGKAFYNVNGKIFCEEDYLYSGFQQSAKKCSACGHPIMEMILQALGKSFHPGCFRCCICNKGLDGIPFTVDVENKIYCVEDYNKIQRVFAPKCAKCQQPIAAVNGKKETVKVVSMGKDFHLDCFVCERCGIQLNAPSKPKYFLFNGQLLCHVCRDVNQSIKSRSNRNSLQNFPSHPPPPSYSSTHSMSNGPQGNPIRVRSLEIERHHNQQYDAPVPRVKSWHPSH